MHFFLRPFRLFFPPCVPCSTLLVGQQTLLLHADLSTPPEPTGLTLASHPHVHLTVAALFTHVRRAPGDAAPEET